MDTLTPFERDALSALLSGDDATLAVLRNQAAVVEVISRQTTGVGFFTDLSVPEGAIRPELSTSCKIGDVFGTADELQDGFGLVLHVDNGLITALEGYSFGDYWPDELRNVTFRYQDSVGRDFNALKQLLH